MCHQLGVPSADRTIENASLSPCETVSQPTNVSAAIGKARNGTTAHVAVRLFASVSSQAERVLFDLYLSATLIVAVVFNILIVVIIVKSRSNRRTDNVIIAFNSIMNLVLTISYVPFALSVLRDQYPTPNNVVCQVCAYATISSLLAIVHAMAINAYERCFFLCNPVEHMRRFTPARVCVMLAAVWIVAVLMSLFAVFDGGRAFFVSGLCCQGFDASPLSLVPFVLYLGPGILVTFYSVVKIKRLGRRSIGPTAQPCHQPGGAGSHQADEPSSAAATMKRTQRKQISTIRTILLVSGVFLFSFVPTGFVRMYMNHSGITWLDLEMRTNIAMTIGYRLSNIAMSTTMPVANPILYLAMMKHINIECRSLFGIRNKVNLVPMTKVTVTASHI